MSNRIPTKSADYFRGAFSERLRRAIEITYGPRGIAEFCRQSGIPRKSVENYLDGTSVPDLRRLEEMIPFLRVDPARLILGEAGSSGIVAEPGASYNDRAAAKRLRELASEMIRLAERLEGKR